ncbi:Protein mlp1 [Lithohypha guttulata]|nr:Protein mlp1 [Lithohypha guttulata]
MAADIDVRSIAVFASVSESTVNTILSDPTAALVHTFLQSLENRAKHCEQVKSQKTKLEVELETVVRTNESKTKVLQNSRDRAIADASKLRQDLQTAESVRAQAQSELEGLRQSIESESLETTSLRAKFTSLETSHRDTLSLLDSKSKEIDRLAQDLTEEHNKVVALRREVSTLEQQKQEASSATTSAKFRQASLEQELELQKKNIDWYESERKIKNDEHQKFRREKNARVSELQRSLDQQTEQTDSLRRSENSLKSQLEEQGRRSEDLLKQIEKLQEKDITTAEQHRIEVDSLNRLVDLHKSAAETARARVEELSQALEEARDDAADEIGKIRAEIQEEHNERQAAEQHVSELEIRISALEAELQQPRTQPGTPRFETNGPLPSTPARPGTPSVSFTPRSTRPMKNGMTTTQLFAAYNESEKRLVQEIKANEQLQAYVDSMLEDLEASRPQIDELRNDQARLQNEVVEISQLADEAKQQRDAAKKEASMLQGNLDKISTELEEARQMCRDLGSQVRRLLLEQQAGALSDAEYNRLVNDLEEVNQRDINHLSSTQQHVNQYLLGFRTIAELQEQNEKQLGTIRGLVSRLDSEEARETQNKYQQLEKDLEAANAKINDYRAEIQHMVAQQKSYVKERDMFKNMLTRRGQIDPADFSRSLPAAGLSTSLLSDRASPAVESDLTKLVKDLQSQYDSFRRDTRTDAASMRTQITDLSQRNSQLHAEASRNLGQFTAVTQRYEMLQANHEALKLDHQNLQKRANAASETSTKQELRIQQVAEELVETKGILDGLRRESANLKAEKDLWKSIEKRLIEDNESLRNERSRLDHLNTNLQNLLNEKEQSDSESRRRYQAQNDSLELDLQSARRRLEEEIEEKKQIALRRTYEHEQIQKRNEELLASMGTIREELTAAKTSKDHLQARVDELTVELRSAEERLEVLARPTTRTISQTSGTEDDGPSTEQELAVQISELKRDLDLRTAELAKTNADIEQYKAIAQDAEDRLAQIEETVDQDKQDVEISLTERDQKIKDLEQSITDISSELLTTNSELSKLHDEQAESSRRLEEQRNTLQAEIDRLKESEEKAQEQAALYLEASREQQKIAEDRQQSYEAELLKHTEAVKSSQDSRAEANRLRIELAEVKSEAQNAVADLQQKQSSWADMESRYKQEVLNAKNRDAEKDQHNKSLLATLETLQKQTVVAQRSQGTTFNIRNTENAENQSHDLSSLMEQIRRQSSDLEVATTNLTLRTLDADRLTRQVQSLQSQLDDARLKLDQEQRASINLEKSNLESRKLVETINELNLNREANTTLRIEKKQAEQILGEKTQELQQLKEELIPLRAHIVELEHELELKQGEMDLLQKDRDSWQLRTQNILSKYDRVDPAELEEMKTRVSELEAERDQAVAAQTALQARIDEFPETVEAAKAELRTRLGEQFKTRDRDMKEKRNQLQADLNSAVQERDAAVTERDELQTALTAAQNAAKAEQPASSPQESTPQARGHDVRIKELEKIISDKDAQIAALTATQAENKVREEDVKKAFNDRFNALKREAEAAKDTAVDEERARVTTEFQRKIEDLKAEQKKELADLRAQILPETGQVDEHAKPTQESKDAGPGMTFEDLANNLTTEQARVLVKREPLKAMIKNTVKKEAELRKAAESGTESSDKVEPALPEDFEERLAERTEALIHQKQEEFNLERENIIKEQQEAFELQKQALNEEHQQKLAEEVAKAKTATEKMAQGKLTLIQKQSANNLAKINAVKRAAEETPEKPVKEVWEVAKTAKPPVEAPKPGAAQPSRQTPSNSSAGTSAPSTSTTTSAPAPTTEETVQQPILEQAGSTNGGLSPHNDTEPQDAEAGDEATQFGESNAASAVQSQAQAVRSNLPQPPSQLPRGSYSNRGQRGGPQAARGTGIPRGGGNFGNNTVNVNSRGGRGGRGAYNSASPGRGGSSFNPNAAQFTPSKRQREDGTDDGNLGKRIRGGGAGS